MYLGSEINNFWGDICYLLLPSPIHHQSRAKIAKYQINHFRFQYKHYLNVSQLIYKPYPIIRIILFSMPPASYSHSP